MAMNITNGTLLGANNYVSGRFLPHSLCFGVVTQQETYYIILVSSSVQVIYHLRPLHTCDIWGCLHIIIIFCLYIQAGCAILICPWAFFKFTASKYLQLTTVTMKVIGNNYYY